MKNTTTPAINLLRACVSQRIGETVLGVIVFPDGSMEATIWADRYVRESKARYATPTETASYERQFEQDDARANR